MSIESTDLHIKMEPDDLQIYDCNGDPNQIDIPESTTTADPKQNLNDFGTDGQCIHCTKQFPSIDALHGHLSSRARGQTQCNQCNLTFPSRKCLTHHQEVLHVASAPTTCPACPTLSFDTTGKWTKHQQTIHSIYECNVCKAQFPTSYRLQVHRATHSARPKRIKSAPVKNFQCIYCKRQFGTLDILKHHQSLQYVGTKRCADCNFEFPSRMCYIEHRDMVHLATSPMVCAECPSLSFDTTLKWQRHQRNVHSVFECSECDAILPSKSRMKNHKLQHADVALRTCVKCNIVMVSVSRLAEHTNLVHARDPAKCTHCARTFANKSRLKRHIQMMHVRANQCECDLCGATLRGAYSLRLHMARFHNPDEPFPCDACLCRFATYQKLNLHLTRCRGKANKSPSAALVALPSSTQLAHGPSELVPGSADCASATAPDEIQFEMVLCDAPIECAAPPIVDTESKSLLCDNCQKPFNSLVQLQAHLKWNVSFPSLKCTTHHKHAIQASSGQDKCAQNIKLEPSSVADCILEPPADSGIESVVEPFVEPSDPAKRLFECIYCKRTYRRLNELRGHVRTNKHVWMCLPCDRRFPNQFCMTRHVNTMHLVQQPIVCSECPQFLFRHLSRWSAHRRNEHSLHDCYMCHVPFSTENHLQKHYNVQHRDVAFVAKCGFCAKIYTTANALRCHIRRVHKRREPAVCDRCQRTFRTNESLRFHVQLRHNPSSAFGCDRCLCSFATQEEFDRHLTFRGCRMFLKSET